MTWLRVIILSVVSAAVVALLNCIPALERTSFVMPAETTEAWIVLAIYIIWNCKGYKDAMCKTFVFFLISQPLIYLIEVPFKALGWGLFNYYPFWAVVTVLTIPGAALCYRVKKGDIWSALILSVANASMILTGLSRINTVLYEFPRMLISLIFCIAVPFLLIFLLLREKKSRIVAVILAVVFIIIGLCMYVFFQSDSSTSYPLEEGTWHVVSVSEPGIKVEVGEESMSVSSHRNGSYVVILGSDDGRTVVYNITVKGGNHAIYVREPQNLSDSSVG